MAAGSEVRGSRSDGDQFFRKTGTMLFVSDDGTTGIPVTGTTFFTTKAAATETAPNGRICVGVTSDWNSVSGLCVSTARFLGFPAYA